MKLLPLIFMFLLLASNVSAQDATLGSVSGGSNRTDLGYNIVINKNSTLQKTWHFINQSDSPVVLEDTGIETEYKKDYIFSPRGKVTLKNAISAVEVRFLLFDVFGDHIKTLSATEINDFAEGATVSISDWGTWRAWENEIRDYLTSVAFVAQARTSDGRIWHYNPEIIEKQIQRIDLNATSKTLDPTKE